jgi:xylulokinase
LNVVRHADAEVGPSLGAARLAWLACEPAEAGHIFRAPEVVDAFAPRAVERTRMLERAVRFAGLYESVENQFKP